ncbi:MAG: ribosome maturation factor RimM [Candidatus Obscuribacterales bacterium]|nr:ribosome maturation factor RimM [Candidatus Obscuribacterales bacterium]
MNKKEESTKAKSSPAGFPFGKIVGFHGLDGEVKVRPSSNKPELLAGVKNLQTKPTKAFSSVNLEIDSSYFDKRMYYLSFHGYPDRTSVEHLMGAELLTWEEELEALEEEEFWVKDLVGMTVYKSDGEEVGKVIDIIYSGNDLLEIRRENDPPGKTILVPFVKSIVPTVNMADKKILLNDIPGLLEAQ